MDLNRNPHRVLSLFAFYQAAVAGLCMAVLDANPGILTALALAHVAAAALLFRAAAGASTRDEGRRRLALPYALWLACWLELGWLIGLLGQPMRDVQVAANDLALFGGHGHLLLSQWLPQADQLMQLLYLSYYGIVLGPPLVLAWRRRIDDCDRYTLAVMTTYLMCFLVYLLYPVLGPRAAAEAIQATTVPGDGLLSTVAELLRRAGDSPGTAFPSSHCAGAFAAAMAAGKLVSRRTRTALLIWAGMIALSTIHTGNHYGVDAAAGVLVAVGVRLGAVRVPGVRSAMRREATS